MADDIKGLTAELARDPASLVFLQLGEALRARGQVDAAAKVALTGLQRHPDLADAHDVYARVLIDAGNVAAAHEAWRRTLQLEPRHVGALKGIGFLFYRYGDLDAALDHLETALSVDPTDGSVIQALRRVRSAAEPVERTADVFAGFEGSSEGILLVDDRGRVLGGSLRNARNEDAAEVGNRVGMRLEPVVGTVHEVALERDGPADGRGEQREHQGHDRHRPVVAYNLPERRELGHGEHVITAPQIHR